MESCFSAWYLWIAKQSRLWKAEKTHKQSEAWADRQTPGGEGEGPHTGHLRAAKIN